MPQYSLGWIKSKPDPRDWVYAVPKRVAAAAPPALSLTPGLGPVLDQGSLGSCGPNSSDGDVMYEQATEEKPVRSISRLHLYWWTRFIMGTVGQDSGVSMRDLMKALNLYGYCDESLWPYDTKNFRTKPPDAANQAALLNRISNYAMVVQTLEQMKGTLFLRNTFPIGMNVYQQIMSDEAQATGMVRPPKPGETPIGGHAVLLVGYDDNTGLFEFRNSWGNWGKGGNGFVTYEFLTDKDEASDFWVSDAIPNGPPPPTPPGGQPTLAQCQAAASQAITTWAEGHDFLNTGIGVIKGTIPSVNDALAKLWGG